MVGLDGLGPSTSALSEQRSNHLSYKPTIENYFNMAKFKIYKIKVKPFY